VGPPKPTEHATRKSEALRASLQSESGTPGGRRVVVRVAVSGRIGGCGFDPFGLRAQSSQSKVSAPHSVFFFRKKREVIHPLIVERGKNIYIHIYIYICIYIYIGESKHGKEVGG